MIVIKIILFILLAVLGIILLVLILPVQAQFSFIGGKLNYKLKYAFVNVMDSEGGGLVPKLTKGKKKKPKKKKEDKSETDGKTEIKAEKDEIKVEIVGEKADEEKDKKSEETLTEEKTSAESEEKSDEKTEDKKSEKKKKKKSLGEIFELISGIWYAAKRPLRKILKGFRFTGVYIDFLIANEDAYKCALNYGRVCGVLYNVLAQMSILFTVKLKTVDVECGFAQEKSRWDAAAKLTFVPMTAVIAGIWFLITYIFRVFLPQKRQAKKQAKKAAEMQKTQPQGGM